MNAAYVKEHVDFAKQNNKEFIVVYGQTGAVLRMAYLPLDKTVEKSASIGTAIPGGELCIVNTSGKNIEEPEVEGELAYKGENVCLGYAEKRMDPRKGDENYGEFHIGGIAKFDVDGFFYITGRMKCFVRIWGNRTNLDIIERLVKVITPNCAYGRVDDLITTFVIEDGLEEKIKALLTRKIGFNPHASVVKQIGVIPVKTSGEIDHPEPQKML